MDAAGETDPYYQQQQKTPMTQVHYKMVQSNILNHRGVSRAGGKVDERRVSPEALFMSLSTGRWIR
jgi:hypothetical protein